LPSQIHNTTLTSLDLSNTGLTKFPTQLVSQDLHLALLATNPDQPVPQHLLAPQDDHVLQEPEPQSVGSVQHLNCWFCSLPLLSLASHLS
jgi:hypothetical protein